MVISTDETPDYVEEVMRITGGEGAWGGIDPIAGESTGKCCPPCGTREQCSSMVVSPTDCRHLSLIRSPGPPLWGCHLPLVVEILCVALLLNES